MNIGGFSSRLRRILSAESKNPQDWIKQNWGIAKELGNLKWKTILEFASPTAPALEDTEQSWMQSTYIRNYIYMVRRSLGIRFIRPLEAYVLRCNYNKGFDMVDQVARYFTGF